MLLAAAHFDAALLQMQSQTSSLSPQAPKTTATANSFFLSSTTSTRHSSGVRFPTRHLPALRTSSQKHKATVPESSLPVEMNALEDS
jgi:hypothetical protein